MGVIRRPALNELPPPPRGNSGWPWTEEAPALPDALPNGMPWPGVSIVTPSFNQASSIEETIRSVLLQGYLQLEYIIIDGGSTDGSVDVIRKYSPWLSWWVSEQDRGQSHAVNKGVERATGAILAWLNSDDVFMSGALRTSAEAFADSPEAVLIYGNARLIDHHGGYMGDCYAAPYDRQLLLTHANPIPQPSAFFRRQAFAAAGGLDEKLHFAMDYDLWLRLGLQGKVIYIPSVCSKMRVNRLAKTSSGDHRMYTEIRRVIERHGGTGLPVGFEPWLVSTHLRKAFEAYRRGDVSRGRDELAYLLQNAPTWRSNPNLLIKAIASRAWLQSPGLTGDDRVAIAFAERACSQLPAEVVSPARVRRQTLALLYEAFAFRRYRRGESRAVLGCAWQAIAWDSNRIKNRGLWSIALRSMLRGGEAPLEFDGQAMGGRLRKQILQGLRMQRAPSSDPVRSRTGAGADNTTLMSFCFAASIVGLLDGLETLGAGETARWRKHLLDHQDPASGLFVDPILRPQNLAAGDGDGRNGAWQGTLVAIAALHLLGATYNYPLAFVEAYRSRSAVQEWLFSQNWSQPSWLTSLDWCHPRLASSARVMFLASFLILEGERTGDEAYRDAAHAILDWLDERQDPDTGYWILGWGTPQVNAMISVCHFSFLYFCLGRPVRYADRLIDSTLALQQSDGLFDPHGGGSACADLNAVDILVKFGLLTDYRAETTKAALKYTFKAILARQVPQDGFARSGEGEAGYAMGESDLRSRWMRLQALALISSRYPGEYIEGINWQFEKGSVFGWHDVEKMRVLRDEFYS